jgi:hypothetical protein
LSAQEGNGKLEWGEFWQIWRGGECWSSNHPKFTTGNAEKNYCKLDLWASILITNWQTGVCFQNAQKIFIFFCSYNSFINIIIHCINKTLILYESSSPWNIVCCIIIDINDRRSRERKQLVNNCIKTPFRLRFWYGIMH